MKRFLHVFFTALIVLAVAVAAAGAAGDPPLAAAPPTASNPVSVAVADCHPTALQTQRYVTFAAQMAAVRRSAQMWVRFTLLERLPADAALHPASAPGLNVWQKSTPGINLFSYSQEVANLPAPGVYRAQVSFRWYNARHRLLRRARRETPACAMPDERPHLKVGAITRQPGADPQAAQYDVVVRNEGLGAATDAGVLLSVDGAAQPQQTIAELGAGAAQTLTFAAPRCSAGGSLTVTLDPAGSVDQTTRADDTKTVACPAS